MTREETKELLPIMQAFAEGKIIEYRNIHGQWVETDQPVWGGYKLRIKPESKYRYFKSQEECWNEMLKHQPFGWIYDKANNCYNIIINISEHTALERLFNNYTFADGTPFGIKES